MTTLISLLGKSKLDRNTGYRTATYHFDDSNTPTAPFFGMALRDYIKPNKLILAGTAGSMWDVFFDHQKTDDEATLALIDAVTKETVTPAMLVIHEQRLTEKLGIPVQCLLIPYARDEAEQTAILASLADNLQPSEEIILDVTHGFRHLPMLALVAARYLALVRGIKVKEVYYGALDMTDPATGHAPVLRLSAMLRMLDWVEALAVYEHSGDYGVLSPLLKLDGMEEKSADLLAQGAYFERVSNPEHAKQILTGAHKHVCEHQGPMGNLFKGALSERIGWFRRGTRADWELALADRYLKRQDYLRAITYLYEGYISRVVEKSGGDINRFEDRNTAFDNEKKNRDVQLLTRLRNAMAHGVRSNSRDCERLLQNQQLLDNKLRALRKSLFNFSSR